MLGAPTIMLSAPSITPLDSSLGINFLVECVPPDVTEVLFLRWTIETTKQTSRQTARNCSCLGNKETRLVIATSQDWLKL